MKPIATMERSELIFMKEGRRLISPSGHQVRTRYPLSSMIRTILKKLVGRVALEKGSEELGSRLFLLIQDWISKIIRAISTSMKLNAKGRPLPFLDPYAKSLAAWNSELSKTDAVHKVAKAAFVDPSRLGSE